MNTHDRFEGGNFSEIFVVDDNHRTRRVGYLEANPLDAEKWTIRDGENSGSDERCAPGGIGAEKSREHHQDRHEVGDFDRSRKPGENRSLGADDFAFAALSGRFRMRALVRLVVS